MHGEPVYAARALQIGAEGYVSKNASPEELRTALSRVASGLTYVEGEIAQALAALPVEQRQQLSERDLEILRLLGEGRSFSEIAAALGLGYKTVANTATMIKSKLGVGAHRRPDPALGGNGNRPLAPPGSLIFTDFTKYFRRDFRLTLHCLRRTLLSLRERIATAAVTSRSARRAIIRSR